MISRLAPPRTDRQVGMPRDQRGDEREQGGEVGGQVDVAVGENPGVRGSPYGAQGPTPALLRHPARRHRRQLAGEPGRDEWGGVGAGVVGDGDPERVRKMVEKVGVQPADGALEVALLVVDGDDDVEHRGDGLGGRRAGGRDQVRRHHAVVRRRSAAVPAESGGRVVVTLTRSGPSLWATGAVAVQAL